MSYRAFFQPVKTLTQAQRQEMASLYFMYYTGSDGTQFYQISIINRKFCF